MECRNCGAGAPRRAHFCPQCEHILHLSRHGDYFIFFGLPRRLTIDPADLEERFRTLSRQFHPDFFYNGTPAERLASLERSSYLNDAYRVLRQPIARVEYLLGLEGLGPAKGDEGHAKVPPALLEEVFTLNEELDDIRERRESGADTEPLRRRLDASRATIESKRDAHDRQLHEWSAAWDYQHQQAALEALRNLVLERNYLMNLLAAIDRELVGLGGGEIRP